MAKDARFGVLPLTSQQPTTRNVVGDALPAKVDSARWLTGTSRRLAATTSPRRTHRCGAREIKPHPSIVESIWTSRAITPLEGATLAEDE